MATRQNRFLLRRSNVPGNIPSPGQILLGELALNTADVILYASGTTSNSILPIGWDRISRTGDTVTGNFIFNGGITATTISATTYQNLPIDVYVTGGTYSSGTATFTNNTGGTFSVTGFTSSAVTATTLYVDYIDFNNTLTPIPANLEGRIFWDDNNGTLTLGMHGSQVAQQIGLESYYYIKNQSGATIENGKVVRASGTLGASGRILGEYMIADGSIEAKYTLGIATEDILNGDDGYVTEFGLVRGIDTTGSLYGETWSNGDILYVSPTISGGLTNVRPTAPDLHIEMAIVVYANANGSIFVRPHRYPSVGDLQGVILTGIPSNYDILQYSSPLSAFTNTNSPSFVSVSATTMSATTYYGDGSNLTGISGGTDSYVTGVTISGGVLTLERNNALPNLTASTVESRSLSFTSNAMALNTASRVTLTPIVMSVTRFAGIGAIDDAGVSFIVPQDYLNTPQFYFTWRATTTSANNAKIFLSIYTGDTGNLGSLTTPVETLTFTVTPTNANTFLYSSTVSSSLNLTGSDSVHVRIYRDPGDAGDTYTGDLDMINFVFKYNSKS